MGAGWTAQCASRPPPWLRTAIRADQLGNRYPTLTLRPQQQHARRQQSLHRVELAPSFCKCRTAFWGNFSATFILVLKIYRDLECYSIEVVTELPRLCEMFRSEPGRFQWDLSEENIAPDIKPEQKNAIEEEVSLLVT